MPEIGLHKIEIEGEWEIHDLYVFPHRYSEVYSFLYALNEAQLGNAQRFSGIFQCFPWRGGYSAINFYDSLYSSIPSNQRPKINRIEYASPGFIEVGAVLLLVTQIDKIVSTTMNAWDKVDSVYTRIHKRAMQRRLLRLNVKEKERKIAEEDVRFVVESTKELAEAVGIIDPAALDRLTNDPLASLKILMGFYRRLRELLYFIDEGKVRITPSDSKHIRDSK